MSTTSQYFWTSNSPASTKNKYFCTLVTFFTSTKRLAYWDGDAYEHHQEPANKAHTYIEYFGTKSKLLAQKDLPIWMATPMSTIKNPPT